MRTIPRNHKAKVAEIREKFTQCVIRSLDSNFEAKPAEAKRAWDWFDQYPKMAKLKEKVKDEVYLIQLHRNLWWELTLPKAEEKVMDKVRLIFTDDDLWVYPAGEGDAHYITLIGANLDVESLTVSQERMEEIREKVSEVAPDMSWHDMRTEKPAEEAQVIVYDDADEFLSDWLSADDQIWPRD